MRPRPRPSRSGRRRAPSVTSPPTPASARRKRRARQGCARSRAAPGRARIMIGRLVTRVPSGKSPEQSGPWPTTSPMNSWPMTVSRSESHTNRVGRVRMVHVVHVRRADRRGQRLDQQFAGAGHRIGRLPNLELPVAKHHRAHQPAPPCLAGGVQRKRRSSARPVCAGRRSTPLTPWSGFFSPTGYVGPLPMFSMISRATSSESMTVSGS